MSGSPPSRYKPQEWILIGLLLLKTIRTIHPKQERGEFNEKINVHICGYEEGKKKQDACYTGITRDAGADSFIPKKTVFRFLFEN